MLLVEAKAIVVVTPGETDRGIYEFLPRARTTSHWSEDGSIGGSFAGGDKGFNIRVSLLHGFDEVMKPHHRLERKGDLVTGSVHIGKGSIKMGEKGGFYVAHQEVTLEIPVSSFHLSHWREV